MSNGAGPGCYNKDGAGTDTGTMDDVDRSEKAEGKVDITILDKTNKTPTLVRYLLNV